MDPLELSAIGTADQLEVLSEVLTRFDPACRLQRMAWESGWTELAQIGLYRFGPDVSMVGTTWLDSIVATGALRPFSDQEVESLGGVSIFLPVAWQSARLSWGGTVRTWAIPWVADVRLVYYWRDMLERAGVDEATAFQTPERVVETMERLRASDVEAPWGCWASTHTMTLQNASSWVWGAGGDYISADGRKILFNQPEALYAFVSYVGLHRYLPPDVERIESTVPLDLFTGRRIAVAVGNPGWLSWVSRMGAVPDASAKLGVAALPGPAFVGGSALVIWQHARRWQEALDLVRFLTSKQVQLEDIYRIRHLPARQEVLAEPPYATDDRYRVMVEALKAGRTYPAIPKWGAVEKKLGEALVWLWNSLVADPDQDVEGLVAPYLDDLARRLMVTLGGRG